MMAELTDYLSEQVLELVAKSIKKKFQYNQLIEAVQEIEKEYKQTEFEHLLWQEEFDWDGLKQYIDDHLLSSISSVFLSPNQDVRKALRKQVYICAYSSAQADTVARQRQVDRLMDKVLIQVRTFLCGQQDAFQQMPFNEVTDQICVSLDTLGEEIKEVIEQQTQKLEKQLKNLQESLEYQHSFAKVVDHIKLPPPINSLFHYRDPQVGFYGREKEITYLDRFLDSEEPILFTAVNGPAGAGKSKFLYEYIKGLASNPKWKCLFLQRNILEKFLLLDEWYYSDNLLVVIDYAGDYAELIGEWLVALKTGSCPPKMRIVLLEREGAGKNRNNGNMQEKALANPIWYERLLMVHSNDDIRAMRYVAGEDNGFLELSTLSDDAFKQIITDYAKAANKKLSERDQEEILDYCKTIEKNEQGVSRLRPLILLFIVDAWDQEGKHRKWNIRELLLRIIKRYKKYWKTTLCEGDQSVFMAVQRLLIYATATGGWKIGGQLPEYLQKDFLAVKNFCETQKKLKQLFLGVNEKSAWDGILSPLEPDLIGELFVLDYLQNTMEYQEMVAAFNTNSKYLLFILRSILDYADVDDYAYLFGDGLKGLLDESWIMRMPEFYAVLLRFLIYKQKIDNAIVTLGYLKSMALDSQYAGNDKIVLEYAMGLYNLACNQEVTEAEETVEKLGDLVRDSRYAGNEEIVFVYAAGLVNLTFDQGVEKAKDTVKKLRILSSDSRYVRNEEIVLMYVKGLFNLANVQEVREAENTMERLRRVSRDSRYAGNEEIVLIYVNGLFNLANAQEVREAEKTVKRLGNVASDSRYAKNKEIVLVYAEGMVNLVAKQEAKEAESTVERFEKLASDRNYADNEEIILLYAKGLFNLATKQEVKEVEETLKKLGNLASDSRYVRNEEIMLLYAQGLFNLANAQEVWEAEKMVKKLEDLVANSRYAGNEEIVLTYVKSLFNLAAKQGVKEAEKTVEKLEYLINDCHYVGNEEILLAYAKVLINLVVEQEVKKVENTVEKLEKMASDSRYARNEEFVLMYAKGLFNLGAKQKVKEAEKTVERLGELASDSRYARNKEIVLEYARGLFNLAYDQEVTEAEKTLEKLGELVSNSRYAENEEIVLMYADGLVIFGLKSYIHHNLELAEKKIAKAHQMGCREGSILLSYMIRRRETKMYSPSEVKQILLPLLSDNNPLAVMNMALYLAEYEDDWQNADDMIFASAETTVFSGVIKWWSSIEDLEGLLVMTWLEHNKICMPHYTLKAKKTLELLRSKYPQVPDWIIEIRK